MSDRLNIDPVLAAREAVQMKLPKRFYKTVSVGPHGDATLALLLDGRPAKTPARRLIAFENEAVAKIIAAEWDAQTEEIDPSKMPATRLANTAIDGFGDAADAVRDDLARYAGSDLLCYRAESPDSLIESQETAWAPLLDIARNEWGMDLKLAQGVMHVAQPPEALAEARNIADDFDGIFLAALHVLVTLTGSYVLAMAVALGKIDAEKGWYAAHVDEDWQISQWGEDAEAMERRKIRRFEYDTAVAVLQARG